MLHRSVYVRRQQIPDVPFDLAAGATIEVYMEGFVTSVAISADDPVQPGLFTIRMKAGSNKVAELVRTAAEPGGMDRILYLEIEATGRDTSGNVVTHSQTIRVKPSVVGAAATAPVGCTLVRDPHTTVGSRRTPMMIGSASPWVDGPAFSFVLNARFLEDGLVNQVFAMDGLAVLVQRNAAHRIVVRIEDSAGAVAINWTSTGPLFNSAAGLCWFAFSCDLAGSGAARMWGWTAGTGDVDLKPASPTIVVGTGSIDLGATKPSWGSTGVAAELRAAIRREWIDNRYFDFAQATERRKFWKADGTPVDLGPEGRVDGVRPAYDLYTGTPGDYLDGFNRGHAEAPAVNDTWGLGLPTNLDPLPF
jgi:hypothetical protein